MALLRYLCVHEGGIGKGEVLYDKVVRKVCVCLSVVGGSGREKNSRGLQRVEVLGIGE